MRYIERGTVLEVDMSAQIEVEAAPAIDSITASVAVAGQRYIEDPAKVDEIAASFGTIGETLGERIAFWDLLEKHERNADCRVQERLILELPHEASSQARREMVRDFCGEFERLGLPYWAALHAPGPENDRRNYHAHVVYATRPARRMVDPATGRETWDFAIVEEYRSASRNRKFRHPHRQRRCAEMTRKGAIAAMRSRFAAIVTAICERDGVQDAAGRPVRYDPRSHDAMGVGAPVMPLRHRSATKAREGSVAVPDGGQTRASLDAVRDIADVKRDRALAEVADADRARKTTAEATAGRRRRRVPASASDVDRRDVEMWAAMPGVMAERLTRAQCNEHGREADEHSDRAALTRLVEATSPAAVARPASPLLAAPMSPNLDLETMRLLHEAARAEMEDYEADADRARRQGRRRADILSLLCTGAVDGPDEPPVPLSAASIAARGDIAKTSPGQHIGDVGSEVPSPGLSSMVEILAEVRARLPEVLGVMDRVLTALRAMPVASRMRVLARPMTTDTLADLLTSAAAQPAGVVAKEASPSTSPVAATVETETGVQPTSAVSAEAPVLMPAGIDAVVTGSQPLSTDSSVSEVAAASGPVQDPRAVPARDEKADRHRILSLTIKDEGIVVPQRAKLSERPPHSHEQGTGGDVGERHAPPAADDGPNSPFPDQRAHGAARTSAVLPSKASTSREREVGGASPNSTSGTVEDATAGDVKARARRKAILSRQRRDKGRGR